MVGGKGRQQRESLQLGNGCFSGIVRLRHTGVLPYPLEVCLSFVKLNWMPVDLQTSRWIR